MDSSRPVGDSRNFMRRPSHPAAGRNGQPNGAARRARSAESAAGTADKPPQAGDRHLPEKFQPAGGRGCGENDLRYRPPFGVHAAYRGGEDPLFAGGQRQKAGRHAPDGGRKADQHTGKAAGRKLSDSQPSAGECVQGTGRDAAAGGRCRGSEKGADQCQGAGYLGGNIPGLSAGAAPQPPAIPRQRQGNAPAQ